MSEGKGTEGEEKGQETDGKLSASSYKDNTDVVLREDLKGVFEKFGTVKVNLVFSLFSSRWNFMAAAWYLSKIL